jgi:hypothetical protein
MKNCTIQQELADEAERRRFAKLFKPKKLSK